MLHDIMRSDPVYHHSIWVVGLAMAAGAVAASLLLQAVVGRIIDVGSRRRHNVVTGAIISIIGVTYAVLLAFVAMLAWENYDSAKAATSHEAARLSDVVRTVAALADPARSQVRANLADYARAVEEVEWPALAEGRTSLAGELPLDRAYAALAAFRPGDLGQGNIQAASIAALVRLRDARDARLAAAETAIPGIVWFVVVAGGAITLVITSLLGTWSVPLHLALAALLSLSGTLVLVMIVGLSHPFRGDFRVTSAPFALALTRMEGG